MFDSIGIAGFRSYSPKQLQQISFAKPLTLIWGENGSGKTTIIQALKYVTIGVMPPTCDRGKNFLIEPRLLGESEVKGEIRLKFFAYTGRMVLAIRRALLTLNQKGSKFESIEQILKTKDENGSLLEINHHCAEIQKQIPIILGTSKAILDKIVLCHQQESLWPFEDSATLKNIFDELFQTKKYTQVIEAMWEQRKECQKTIGQIKKALPYLQRLYQEDKNKKFTTLQEMQKVNAEAQNIRPLRQRLKEMELQFGREKEQAKNQLKFRLGKDRRSLQEKLQFNKYSAIRAQESCQSLRTQLQQLNGTKIQAAGRERFNISEAQQKIKELMDARQQLVKLQQSLKNDKVISQKEVEIAAEIANAKQFLPELKQIKREDLTQELISRKISQKVQEIQNKRKHLSILKNELAKCSSSVVILQKMMSSSQYQDQKTKLNTNIKLIEQVKSKILGCYFALYKKIDQSVNLSLKDEDVGEKLKEVEYRIKIKKQEIQHYQKIPKGLSTKQKIYKLQFAGIQFYQHYLQYCSTKKKCSLCSKPMTPEQLKVVTAKCQKIREKTSEQIAKLKQQLAQSNNLNEFEVDPTVVIAKLKTEVVSLESKAKTLRQSWENYQIAVKWREQRKINQKLIQGIKMVKLERQIDPASSKKYQKLSKEASIQLFNDSVQKYMQYTGVVSKKKRQLETYQQQQARNTQKQQQNERNKIRSAKISEEIVQIEEQTKNHEFISRIALKLSTLLSDKQRLDSKKHKRQAQPRTVESVAQQIAKMDESIKLLQLQKDFCFFCDKIGQFKQENQSITNQIAQIDKQIAQIDNFLRESRQKSRQYTNLKVQFQKKIHELQLKADISFLEYRRGSEIEYLKQKAKLQEMEAASRDIEKYCAAVESTISSMHHEKMDAVNKIIFDIWKQVYQGSDIHHIEIDTQYDIDSRKRKNYKYAIMMYKSTDKMVKLQMKGRCSMGQKVLASIVIRMALAQVFSSSARMLTLDEPTTNLDRSHIDHLARQLTRLIEMNGESQKFQLVIISHDLEFISKLEKYTDHYYQVSRNQQQFSVITKKELRGIFNLSKEDRFYH